jgi:hypothetical protein
MVMAWVESSLESAAPPVLVPVAGADQHGEVATGQRERRCSGVAGLHLDLLPAD